MKTQTENERSRSKKGSKTYRLLAVLLCLLTVVGCNPSESADTTLIPNTNAPETAAETYEDVTDGKLNVVHNGTSRFSLVATDDVAAKASALYFKTLVNASTGAEFPSTSAADSLAVKFTTVSDGTLGNNGYSVSVSGTVIDIKAGGLSGFDKALDAVCAGLDAETKSLTVDAGISASETGTLSSYVTPEGLTYIEANENAPFYNDLNDGVAYVCNTMWHQFGLIDDGQGLVYKFGNEPTYYEWMSEKMVWSGDKSYIGELKAKIKDFPQTDTGFLWSWSTYPYWQVGDTYAIHYDGTFRYISAVYDIISWENSTRTLSQQDSSTFGSDTALDASKGKTIYEKTAAAMDYILKKLHGEDGYIQITEDSVYLADGVNRFDKAPNGKYCWNNTGKVGSIASNYWDNLCFGNYDAYENALFYEALQSMAGIEAMLGNTANVQYYTDLMTLAKAKYDELYWSETTGRYIACIDSDNNKIDFGFTFVNYEALKYGLGDAEKAASVFSWIDGERIVEGDTLTGADIMSYTRLLNTTTDYKSKKKQIKTEYTLAALTNTKSITDGLKNGAAAWWHGPDGINVFGSAKYGSHLENGGYIFYTVFYELMARTKYLGADSTVNRLSQILSVYEFNQLKSDTMVNGSTNWLEGLIGEFPESGLVPSVYVYSLLGINAGAGVLTVCPQFPTEYSTMGVSNITYGGKDYDVNVSRDGSMNIICKDNAAKMTLEYTPNRFTSFTCTAYGADGNAIDTQNVTTDESGVLKITLEYEEAASVKIAPVLD